MPAADAATLLRSNAEDVLTGGRPAIYANGGMWTHRDLYIESSRWANLFLSTRRPGRPFHVGVLLDNVPSYLFALGGAALCGATIVGLNHTRREKHLLRDIEHTDVGLIVTEPRHAELLAPIDPRCEVLMGDVLEVALASTSAADPGVEPGPDTTWVLVFTSGTSSAPKAVICSQRRLLTTGVRMGLILDVGPDDIGYVCMPLFHSNALMVGWAPSIVYGASVALAPRFSASHWLSDVRRFGATWFNYTGKPLAYILESPARPDDADNPLRVAYGNEGSPHVVSEFARRFDVRVIDAYGATEGGVSVNRDAPPRPDALGLAGDTVRIVDEDGVTRPPARFDENRRLINANECVGEIVNTAGAGPFEGYYNNPDATARTTRDGWYWSGDLGYVDEDGYIYFAGRTGDWIRVDGENFPAGPIESSLAQHPSVVLAAVYAVPDADAGDQVMAALVFRNEDDLDPVTFAAWVDARPEIGPKWRPRYLRVASSLPTTGTNKVLTRLLAQEKFRWDCVGGDALYVRERGEPAYRRFTMDDEAALSAAFERAGRSRFWDL